MKRAASLFAIFCLLFAAPSYAATVLVTGANRGIGLELVRQYAARGWTVIATTRNIETSGDLKALAAQNKAISIETLDVSDTAAIKTLARKYKGKPVDVLINNAGLLGDVNAQKLGALDGKQFQELMAVNAFAPLAMAEAFRESVASSTQKKVVSISTGNSVISGDSVPGGLYFYRSSKVALNMLMRGLASDVKAQGIIVGIISPGGVDTDMGRAAGGANRVQNIPASESVAGVIKVIDGLTLANSNASYRYDGSTQPW